MAYDDIISRAEAAALIGESVSPQIFAGLAEQSIVMQLATQLPDMPKYVQRLPILDVEPIAGWIDTTDSGLTPTTEAKWANKYLTAEALGCVIVVPEAVFDDADTDIWGQLQPRVISALAKTVDQTVIHGTSAPSSFPGGVAPSAVTAGNYVDLSDQIAASKDIYDMIMGDSGLLALVEADGYFVDGHVCNLAMKAKLRGLRGTDGHPVFVSDPAMKSGYALDGEPLFFPRNGSLNQATTYMVSGAWKELVWAKRNQVQISVERNGVISNGSGVVTHNLKQQRLVALYCTMTFGWQLPNPPNKIQSDIISTSGLTRYPFAVLRA